MAAAVIFAPFISAVYVIQENIHHIIESAAIIDSSGNEKKNIKTNKITNDNAHQ
jgi:hypothetical protein